MSALIQNIDPEMIFQPLPDISVMENDDLGGDQALDTSSDPFALALEMISAPLFLFSPEGDVVFANVAGSEFVSEFAPENHLAFSLKVREVIFGMSDEIIESTGEFEKTLIRVRSMPVGGENLFSVQVEFIKSETNEDLEYLAYHDELTGLKNFRGYNQAMESVKARKEDVQDRESVSMILVDVDNFKKVNDTWGHKFGNKVLAEIGSFLRQSIRGCDEGFRIGGDEFAILSFQESSDKAQDWAARIHRDLTKHLHQTTGNFSLSISMGFAQIENGESENIFEKADETLYQAKENGKSAIVMA